jgi:hypothetical protein
LRNKKQKRKTKLKVVGENKGKYIKYIGKAAEGRNRKGEK